MASNTCWRLPDCFRAGLSTEQDAMTVGSSSPRVRKVSPSKSKFSKFTQHLPFFKRNNHVQDVPDVPGEVKYKEVLLSFQQNLQQHHFAVAEKQLICCEEKLFALKQDEIESSMPMLEEKEELNKDNRDLLNRVMSTIEMSFDVQTDEAKEILKEAVLVIDQEEEQDRRWEGVENYPSWRPMCYRDDHDRLLQRMVLQRMEEATLDSNITLGSSVQREITARGKQLKKDLLQIAKNVQTCYPKENVCQLYAKMYHQVFCDKLREIAEYGLADDDCRHVLQWVNTFYPEILRHEILSGVIEYEHFEPLLPTSTLKQLEEQFLVAKENELRTWCQSALSAEKEADPKLRDNCYLSHLAFDVIQCVNAFLTSSTNVLGSWSKTQRITHQLKDFFINYQDFLEKVIEDNQVTADAVLKANLPCIRDFRDYIMTNPNHFPQHVQNDCIDLLTRTRDTCHNYFIKPIHKALKGTYSKVGTREWIKHNEDVCNELLEGVDKQIQEIRNLDEACLKDLVSKLHEEVLAEYVRKMMKKKIKFKDEKKLQQAAEALCTNSQRMHMLFTRAGSNMKHLEDILPKLAELLTLNDPQIIELQLVVLSNNYPDLCEVHVSAWLYLRANLSTSDLKKIKKTFAMYHGQTSESTVECQDPLHSSRNFFSKVTIK
ncbi:tumor necrosis factor alpha-induced protein 2 isoform 2-T2 [Clarias gariepinus]|uniref:tumor necrosis factor alpha-induced protein 2 isoform X1 n=1 Tax=Clarias gariepinus TaxID=13013 RepID=UPI00234CE3C5|nr:tumor necrosis factor alpha-induced protein 2 isoform X1 [Clarias gariepinus]